MGSKYVIIMLTLAFRFDCSDTSDAQLPGPEAKCDGCDRWMHCKPVSLVVRQAISPEIVRSLTLNLSLVLDHSLLVSRGPEDGRLTAKDLY